jgi:hypothetical protein
VTATRTYSLSDLVTLARQLLSPIIDAWKAEGGRVPQIAIRWPRWCRRSTPTTTPAPETVISATSGIPAPASVTVETALTPSDVDTAIVDSILTFVWPALAVGVAPVATRGEGEVTRVQTPTPAPAATVATPATTTKKVKTRPVPTRTPSKAPRRPTTARPMPAAARATTTTTRPQRGVETLYRRAKRGDRYEIATDPQPGEKLYVKVARGKYVSVT